MRDATIYHRRAAECRELAEHSASPTHRATWRELELLWLRLAAEAERRAGPPNARDIGSSHHPEVGTVVFVYSEPDLRQRDPVDVASGPDRPATNHDEYPDSAPDPGKPTAH